MAAALGAGRHPAAVARVGPAAHGQQALEEIVVTAQKREESLYEVPVAVSAFNDEKLEQAILDDVADLGRYAPSLTANNVSAGGSNIFMRGVGNEIIAVGADSSVAIYVDGVYTPRFTSALNNFVDVERVELVKGPQGTLYGRNATGGAINIVTKQPSAEASFKGDVEISNYSGRKVRAAGGGALSDTLFGRLALVYNKKDNYSYNPVFDERLDVEDMFAVNASIRWQPSDRFEALLRYDYLKDEALGVVSTRVLAPGAGHAGLAFDPDPFVNGSDFRVSDSLNDMKPRGSTPASPGISRISASPRSAPGSTSIRIWTTMPTAPSGRSFRWCRSRRKSPVRSPRNCASSTRAMGPGSGWPVSFTSTRTPGRT